MPDSECDVGGDKTGKVIARWRDDRIEKFYLFDIYDCVGTIGRAGTQIGDAEGIAGKPSNLIFRS